MAVAQAACPAQTNPQFSGGGTVWGRNSAQFNVYFGAKPDAANGCTDNQTLNNPKIFGGFINGASFVDSTIEGTASILVGSTYSFSTADCGKTFIFTSSSAVTATVPASIVPITNVVCIITLIQGGSAKVSVNGSAVTPATLISPYSYTGTSGTLGSAISLILTTVAAVANVYLTGDGS
jgi:hypothetical protein